MLPVSSQQAAGAVQTATQAHNQPYMNTYPPGYGFYFANVNFAHQGLYSAAQHPALYPVQAQAQTASAGSAFAKANTAANYGSHSYNSGYDSLGAVAQTQDYVNKSYPQQLQQHKQMGGTNAGDLTGNSQQSMYGKSHSQMSKVCYIFCFETFCLNHFIDLMTCICLCSRILMISKAFSRRHSSTCQTLLRMLIFLLLMALLICYLSTMVWHLLSKLNNNNPA